MNIDKLYFFVEGLSDEIFINNIIKKVIPDIEIKIIQYAEDKKEKTINYLNSLNSMINDNGNINYYFIADNDSSLPYPDRKISIIKKRYKTVKEENIIIVEKEIENWYLAGITKKTSKKLNLNKIKDINEITKEGFKKLLKNWNIMEAYNEILSDYSTCKAKEKSNSFKYFIEKIEKYK